MTCDDFAHLFGLNRNGEQARQDVFSVVYVWIFGYKRCFICVFRAVKI